MCYRCKGNYLSADFLLKRTDNRIKEPCDICSRYGFEYSVTRANITVGIRKKREVVGVGECRLD